MLATCHLDQFENAAVRIGGVIVQDLRLIADLLAALDFDEAASVMIQMFFKIENEGINLTEEDTLELEYLADLLLEIATEEMSFKGE